jgi:hypothetical protein
MRGREPCSVVTWRRLVRGVGLTVAGDLETIGLGKAAACRPPGSRNPGGEVVRQCAGWCRAGLGAAALALAIAAVFVPAALARAGGSAASCGAVSAAGHRYLVVTAGGFQCGQAVRYVRKLAAERPLGASTGLNVGKLTGGPAGYSCGASGWPQRIGRCFQGASAFTWIKAG